MINPCLSETCSTESSGSKAIPPIAKTSPPILARRTWRGVPGYRSMVQNNWGLEVHLHHPLQLTPCLLIARSPPHFQVPLLRFNTWGNQPSPGLCHECFGTSVEASLDAPSWPPATMKKVESPFIYKEHLKVYIRYVDIVAWDKYPWFILPVASLFSWVTLP